jgi:TonB family protein
MKHLIKLTILFSVFSAGVSFGQTQTTKKEGMNDPQNMTVNTDAEPFYPKGAKDKLVTGEVLMSFDVNPDSTVTNAIVISGPGFGVNEEVKALVEKLKFAPAVQNGVKVRMNVMMNFPVKAH